MMSFVVISHILILISRLIRISMFFSRSFDSSLLMFVLLLHFYFFLFRMQTHLGFTSLSLTFRYLISETVLIYSLASHFPCIYQFSYIYHYSFVSLILLSIHSLLALTFHIFSLDSCIYFLFYIAWHFLNWNTNIHTHLRNNTLFPLCIHIRLILHCFIYISSHSFTSTLICILTCCRYTSFYAFTSALSSIAISTLHHLSCTSTLICTFTYYHRTHQPCIHTHLVLLTISSSS